MGGEEGDRFSRGETEEIFTSRPKKFPHTKKYDFDQNELKNRGKKGEKESGGKGCCSSIFSGQSSHAATVEQRELGSFEGGTF